MATSNNSQRLQRCMAIPPTMSKTEQDCYANWNKEDWDAYEKHCEESELNQPSCSYCHPNSGCDGDHGDECRESGGGYGGGGGGPIYKGPLVSPLTVPEAQAQQAEEADSISSDEVWANDLARLIAESKALREAPLSAFADLAELEDDDTIPEMDIEDA